MGRRERFEAALFHALAAGATLGWWLWLWRVPAVRASFLGQELAANRPFHLLVPDLLALVGGGAWLAVSIIRERPEAPSLAWVHFGAAGYAWGVSAVSAVRDPLGYWGFVGMSALVALAFIFALGLSGVSLLRGPFRLRASPPLDQAAQSRASRRQTAAMWLVFLGILPAVLALAEQRIGWSSHWIGQRGRYVPGLMLFGLGGVLASWAWAWVC